MDIDLQVIAALEDCLIRIPSSTLPQSTLPAPAASTLNLDQVAYAQYEVLRTAEPIKLKNGEARLNEGAADPSGRFLIGSMCFEVGNTPSRLYSLRKSTSEDKWSLPVVHDGISVTNGMAWVRDGSKM